MPKIKTRKIISKRIKKTSTGKILKKPAGQSHYNTRDTGKQGRQKRKNRPLSETEAKTINALTPYT